MVIIIYEVPADFSNFSFCNFSVQKLLFLYWEKYCCTVVYMNEEYSRTTDEYVCAGTYVFFTERLIFFFTGAVIWCTKNWRYLSVLEFIFLY